MIDVIVLLLAGCVGGALNSVAGGGSFVTYPALLFAGVPPISANATNTLSACPGYISGAVALRAELRSVRGVLPGYVLLAACGGLAGAQVLLFTSTQAFTQVLPWLLLLATLTFAFGRRLPLPPRGGLRTLALGGAVLLLVSIYGGFFNAGLGFMLLAALSLAGITGIHVMNAIKLLFSSVIASIAAIRFATGGVIAWREAVIVMAGTMIGGYIAAHNVRFLPPRLVRGFVILAGAAVSAWFFYAAYAAPGDVFSAP